MIAHKIRFLLPNLKLCFQESEEFFVHLLLQRRAHSMRRGMWSKKYSSARPGWRMIPGFQQDASWFKARWRAEMRPLGRKCLRDGRRLKLHCVAAFNEQSAKAIFRKTLTRPNWPIT
jgi:hypothetical protein